MSYLCIHLQYNTFLIRRSFHSLIEVYHLSLQLWLILVHLWLNYYSFFYVLGMDQTRSSGDRCWYQLSRWLLRQERWKDALFLLHSPLIPRILLFLFLHLLYSALVYVRLKCVFYHLNQHIILQLPVCVSPGYKLVGDVDYAGCRQVASQITPVRLTSSSSYLLFFHFHRDTLVWISCIYCVT